MKIKVSALRSIIREAIEKSRIVKERPWSVEYTFSLSKGKAEDSEGLGPDGFAIIMSGASGKTMRVIVDTYWNPQAGDQSGNSIKIEIDGQETESSYIPVRFDTGKKQKLIISNSPIADLIVISHCADTNSVPVVAIAVSNPFAVNEDVQFSVKNLGNGTADVDLTRHSSL